MRPTTLAARRPWTVRGVALAAILASLVVLMGSLPMGRIVRWLASEIEGLGALGPIVYGLIYVVGSLLLVPGAGLTLGAGFVFGLALGTLTVSVASTTAAALAFLAGRYAFRERVEDLAARSPKFRAVDRAVGERGWRIVALLRLSPIIPFTTSNYFYGLTAIRFWPYVFASWIAMLPGTFLYVYLGYSGRAAIMAAATEGDSGRTTGEWILLVAGLAATVMVSAYVTKIALRAIRQRTESEEVIVSPAPGGSKAPSVRVTLSLVAAALILAAGAAFVSIRPSEIAGLFGPPTVEMREAYSPRADGPTFDHTLFDEFLGAHVDGAGWVDYEALARDQAKLDTYLGEIAKAPFHALGRDEKLALLVNAYNAFTLRLILDHRPIESIRDIPADERWKGRSFELGGHRWSLSEIENDLLRRNFREPRIHFAVNCASIGCPPLWNHAYSGAKIGAELEAQTRRVHARSRWFRFDRNSGVAQLTRIYDWYHGDFVQAAGSPLGFAARYSTSLRDAIHAGERIRIEWLPYDWTLNDVANRPKETD